MSSEKNLCTGLSIKDIELKTTAVDNQAYDPDGTETAADTPNGTKTSKADFAVEVENGDINDEKKKQVEEEEEEEEDPWNVDYLKQNYTPWGDLTERQKWLRGISYIVRIILVVGFLYLFICSLDFLSSAFKLLGGKKAGEVFHQSDLLNNPVAGLMMGVLVTVLVQSSSTSTSIIISMVAAQILTVKEAVPIIMGANIGTSVTNTIVSLGQITDKSDFRRAFAGATVHDMFNWLSVLILLPLEVISGYLFRLSGAIVDSMSLTQKLDVNQDLLKTVTKPFTKLIVQVSSSNIKKIATKEKTAEEATLMKFCCDKTTPEKCCSKNLTQLAPYDVDIGNTFTPAQKSAVCLSVDKCVNKEYVTTDADYLGCIDTPWQIQNLTLPRDANTLDCSAIGGAKAETDCCNTELEAASFYSVFTRNATTAEQSALCTDVNNNCYTESDVLSKCLNSWKEVGRTQKGTGEVFSCKTWTQEIETTCNKPCEFLFRSAHEHEGGPLSDEAVGGILLVLSLILLCICLVCIVKLLQSLLKGPIAKLIKKFVNADFPGYCGYFTGYLAILIGAGLTVVVQSSSIFTSTLTPLVGIGVITLDRMYPLTLGSNIGTTATGILAALAQDVEEIPRSLQVAFCHLFFNISGILIFYPLPFFRPPIPAAKFLGNTTAKYRWFAIVYLIAVFFLFPLFIFGLSIPGWYVLTAVLCPVLVIAFTVGVIKCIQAKRPNCLPSKLRNWKFLPRPLRSLEPYDSLMKKMCFCKRLQTQE